MKKQIKIISIFSLILCSNLLSSCGDTSHKITVCASELPHAQILNESVKPLLKAKGYDLEVTVLNWTLQNDAVKDGDYDANYFQHVPYLLSYSGNEKQENVFATAKIHYEPLRIYAGKKAVSYTDHNATFAICNDVSNATRALDLLITSNVISSYDKTSDDNADLTKLPSRISLIAENLLVSSLADYDYAVLPCNTAMTGNIDATSENNKNLPSESETLANAKANIIAASTTRYKSDEIYKNKIDALTDTLLSKDVKNYIDTTWKGVVLTYQVDLRK